MQKLAVFCGASFGFSESYKQSSIALGQVLARRGIALVYGGAQEGLMGIVADAVLAEGGEVYGVIPQLLVEREVAHPDITYLSVVNTMSERKQKMASLADGFIAMPGGIGTLDELFEMLTWAQLGFHQKPCGLLNVDGFFDLLLAFVAHSAEQGFVSAAHAGLLMKHQKPGGLIDLMDASAKAPVV